MAENTAALRVFNHSFDLIITDAFGLDVLSKWLLSLVPAGGNTSEHRA
jgi:hypothetical protein